MQISNRCEYAIDVLAPAELTRAFRTQGLKVTPQRQLLFSLLHENVSHPTVDALFAEASSLMPGISLRTVYQTLNDLAAMGELRVLQLGGGSARFDPNVADHHHTVCDQCGELRDVYVDDVGAIEARGINDFTVDRANIVFGGVCANCRKAPSTRSKNRPSKSTSKPTKKQGS